MAQVTSIGMVRAFVGAAALVLSVSQAFAIEPEIVEAAKKEGQVNWYTTLIVDQGVRPLIAAFQKKYPEIHVDYVRGDNSALVTRILNDSRANKPVADLLDGTATEYPLEKAELISQWLPAAAKAFPAAYREPNNHWVASNVYFLAPVYNTQLIEKGKEPKTFEDLLDPKLKGKMTWFEGDPTVGSASFIANVFHAMGRDKGMAYLEKLSQQNIVPSTVSSRVLADWVIAGEYLVALQVPSTHATISASKGAPIDWIPMSPLVGLISTMALMNNAPHPNAGKLLFDFIISREGQIVLQQAGYITADPAVPALRPDLKPAPGHFEANVITQQQAEAAYPEITALYQKLFKK